MPSASAKIEKVASIEVTDPVKYIGNMLEKRIRNMEKRKIKLDNYRSDVQNGKELNEDQKIAVSKYGEVISCLDQFKEFNKSMNTYALEYARQVKKMAKKEQLERQQHEIQRLQEAFIYSHILSGFQNEDVRSDFLNGENGAVQLSSEHLSQLDQLFKLIGQRSPTEQVDITSYYHVLAENHIFLVEGKNKEIAGTTYKVLKEILVSIKDSGYFSKPTEPVEESGTSSDELPEEENVEKVELVQEYIPPTEEPASLPSPEVAYIAESNEGALEEAVLEAPPTTPATAPLQEVLSQQGAFNFLQESQIDLDAPHMDPAVVAVHQMAPAPSVNFVVNSSYAGSPPIDESGAPVANGIEPCDASVSPSLTQTPMMASPSAQHVLTSIQHSSQHDFDPSHPIPTQTFTNQSFAVMQNMIMPQAYVPVTLHHAPLPTTISVISPTSAVVPVPVTPVPTTERGSSEKIENGESQTNEEESLSAPDANGNEATEEKSNEGNNFAPFRGGYRGRGRGRGNGYFRGRGNYNGRGGGYQNNYYRDRNGYNNNYRSNNRGPRGNGNNNTRGRGNYRSDGPHQQRNVYHQKQQQQDRPQKEEVPQ